MILIVDPPGFGPRVQVRPRELAEGSEPLEAVLAVVPLVLKRSDGYPPRRPGRSAPTPDDLGAPEQRRSGLGRGPPRRAQPWRARISSPSR